MLNHPVKQVSELADHRQQLKNRVFEKGIGKIPLAKYNWLNFFLSDQDKIDMFILGVKTATKFLIEFDWAAYKDDRVIMQVTLNQNKDNAPAI